MPEEGANRGIGTPDELRENLRTFESTGVDQVCFIQQGGRNKHEHICEALDLFGTKVMPEFKERAEERERTKLEELAPYMEQAMERKQRMKSLSDDEIPVIYALGRQIVDQAPSGEETADFGRGGGIAVPLRDPRKS